MYELLIVGGGPGGAAAGVYAARKKIRAVLVTESFGGQSLTSADIQNWIGTKSISGFDLAKAFEEHLRAQQDLEIIDGDLVERVEDRGDSFLVTTKNGRSLEAVNLLISSGSRRRKLGVPGEAAFDGKGVVYCSTCDAPLFPGKEVAVVGGGNAGLEAVIDLIPYASRIYLLERTDVLRGDPVTQEKIRTNANVTIVMNAQTEEIVGDGMVRAVRYRDLKTQESKELAVQGVFVEIGAVPNSEFVKHLVALTPLGEIQVDHKTQRTSHPRVWAIGDVSDVLYKQNNISAGDAVKAVLNIYETIQKAT